MPREGCGVVLFTKVDHVQLAIPAGGEAHARDFYAGALGLEEVPKPAELAGRGGAWFRSGDVALHLGVDPDFRPATKAHPALRCSDYASLIQRLSDAGIELVDDGSRFHGARHCYVSDPFGNRIELISGEVGAIDR